MPDDRPLGSRRAFLRTGVAAAAVGLAGCQTATGDDPLLTEGFESGMDGWSTHSHIGPEEPQSAFDWEISRSQDQAAGGDWSLEVFTEGDHDDGTAWATTELAVPGGASSFSASVSAWSESESFNTLRNIVVALGPDPPDEEADFPRPYRNSTGTPGAPVGGLRNALHLAEGWYEYTFEWNPDSVPDTFYFAVGVSVVWESDATHYIDEIEVTAE